MNLSKTGLVLVFGLTLVLAACGNRQGSTSSSGASSTPPPSAGAPAALPATASQEKPGAAAQTESSTITRINEDGSESVEDTSSDNGAHNPILTAVASTLSGTAAAATTLVAPTLWQEGVNYTRLVPAQPTSVPAGQVEVLEFFWYACPHCYAIDPLVEAWKKTKPAYISFAREHVMWNESDRSLARLFYTLQSMGKIDEMHNEIFKEIHVNLHQLTDPNNDHTKSEEMQTEFVLKHGISAAAFKSAYHSFAVETAMLRGDQLWQRYRIQAVPTFVINGKYVADIATAGGGHPGGEEKMFPLISDLAAIEHKR
jgi:protein dithiol oxidoreductase (disulfide-forming)